MYCSIENHQEYIFFKKDTTLRHSKTHEHNTVKHKYTFDLFHTKHTFLNTFY